MIVNDCCCCEIGNEIDDGRVCVDAVMGLNGNLRRDISI